MPYPKLDFTVQELQERFQQQLEMELDNTVTIESVESTKPLTPQAIKAVKLRESGGCMSEGKGGSSALRTCGRDAGVGGLKRGAAPC